MFISKNSKVKIIDILELLCKKTGISNHSLGVMIRSYHFGMPCAFMFTVLLCNHLIAYISVIYYSLILISYIIFQDYPTLFINIIIVTFFYGKNTIPNIFIRIFHYKFSFQ